jgi:beta-glucosidase
MSDWVGTYSTVEAINAGLDLEMPGPTKFRGQLLLDAIQENRVSEETINKSARRILELVKKIGRFENPDDKDEVYVEIQRDTNSSPKRPPKLRSCWKMTAMSSR